MAPPRKITRKPVKRTTTPVTKPTEGTEEYIEVIKAETPKVIGEVEVPAAVVNRKIKERVPVGVRDPLKAGKLDPRYQYRYVRGNPDRLQMFQDGGYEFVDDSEAVGDTGIMRASKVGTRVTAPSGDNADRLYLMRIPKDLYDQDQKLKQQKIDALEENLKPEAERSGLNGKIDISR